MTIHLLSVDLQHEFASPQGRLYRPRACVPFLLDTVIPTAMASGWPIHQILADYRDPSRGPDTWHCARLQPLREPVRIRPGWSGRCVSLARALTGPSRQWGGLLPGAAGVCHYRHQRGSCKSCWCVDTGHRCLSKASTPSTAT